MNSKTPVVVWLSASCLVTGSFFSSATTLARNTNKQQLIQQMAEAQIKAQQDNEKLKVIMQRTLDAFKTYCHKTGSIPQSPRHIAYLERSLSELAGVNPFNEFPYRIAADDPTFVAAHDTTSGDRRKIAIHLKYEANLSAAQINYWQKSRPENWIEMPGSITILHDEHNACCVWGAGVDGAPIKADDKPSNSEPYIIVDDHVLR
jgi:hypothetical protein